MIGVIIILLLLRLLIPFQGCLPGGDSPFFLFAEPRHEQLSLAGDVPARIYALPPLASRGDLTVTLDGVDVTDAFVDGAAVLPSPAGVHELVATLDFGFRSITATRTYETILVTEDGACDGLSEAECQALNAQVADECEIFNRVECLLPYPSSQLLTEADTPTGFRPNLPQIGLPEVVGPTQIPVSLVNDVVDGFSPTVQILTHFPQGVDVAASGLSRLLPPCLDPAPADEDPECIATSGPPFDGVRSHDDRSTHDPSHGTVILGPDGERVLHWVENDFTDNADRQAFILRPGQSLEPGERYIVAIRDNVIGLDGEPLEAEPAFAALRDHRPTDIPQLVERRRDVARIFRKLRRAGIRRHEVVLALEFVVQSDHSLTHQMLTMRDQGLAWLDEQTQPTFVVDDDGVSGQNDCSDPEQDVWRVVEGRYTVPLFLEGPPVLTNVGQHTVDENDVPVQNGVWDDTPFHVSIPCDLHPDFGDPDRAVHTLLLGHGIFGNGEGLVRGIPEGAANLMDFFRGTGRDTRDWNYVAGATNWSGWSSDDFLWVGGAIIGIGASNLHQFPAFPDRHRQGQLNTLILSRMLARGLFNSHPAFQDAGGNGLLPVPAEDPASGHYYYGISMGGVQGLFHAAISTDIEKFGIDVGSMNFSFLLPRSTQFNRPGDAFSFRARLAGIGLTDDLDVLLGVQLLHELWVSADPAGYMTRVTDPDDLLPGNDFPKKIYMSPAWLDYQVSNHGTEITSRTLGLSSGPGSLQKELVGIPDAPAGAALDSGLVMWDTGLHDILDPGTTANYPPLSATVVANPSGDPHGARPFIAATIQTLMTFLQPGGQIENFCDDNGLCDASQDWECNGGVCP